MPMLQEVVEGADESSGEEQEDQKTEIDAGEEVMEEEVPFPATQAHGSAGKKVGAECEGSCRLLLRILSSPRSSTTEHMSNPSDLSEGPIMQQHMCASPLLTFNHITRSSQTPRLLTGLSHDLLKGLCLLHSAPACNPEGHFVRVAWELPNEVIVGQ
jgi:hypothetical protein